MSIFCPDLPVANRIDKVKAAVDTMVLDVPSIEA